MQEIKITLLAWVFVFTLFNYSFSETIVETVGGVNENQPIYIGEVIYEEKTAAWDPSGAFYHLKYIYTGIDGNEIRIRYEYRQNDSSTAGFTRVEDDILFVPLDKYGITYFQTHALPKYSKRTIISEKKLVISIYNKYKNSIVVEEVDKKEGNPGF